jgi:hypothetical protein
MRENEERRRKMQTREIIDLIIDNAASITSAKRMSRQNQSRSQSRLLMLLRKAQSVTDSPNPPLHLPRPTSATSAKLKPSASAGPGLEYHIVGWKYASTLDPHPKDWRVATLIDRLKESSFPSMYLFMYV